MISKMNVIKRRSDDASVDLIRSISNSHKNVEVIMAKNLLATSITKRVFNINGIKGINVSPYMLVDKLIENINMESLATSSGNIKDILNYLIRNEMIRISIELQSGVDDNQIDRIMNLISLDIESCATLLSN